jgi:hypothetical protein
MKKYLAIPVICLFVCAAVYSEPTQEKVNLVGTWIGAATMEGQPDNELTLVMVEKEGKLSGTITGEYGTLVDTPLENIKLENNVFSFDVMVSTGGGEIKAVFKMKVDGDKMEGEFDIPDMGMGGTWSAERSK